jgi:spore maturation protein CgeB
MNNHLRIAFFGSSIVSSYWNGACTYYRGIVRAMHDRGHEISFYEPDAFERQQHRDIENPPWADVIVYAPTAEAAREAVASAAHADVVIKASGVGICDRELEQAVLELSGERLRIFWDVDAPATLSELEAGDDPDLRDAIPAFDLVLTYGGGDPVVERYRALGARQCLPIYNALDPETHHPVKPRIDLRCDLSFLGNRLPDREARVGEFLFGCAQRSPTKSFLLGGSGWKGSPLPPNVRVLGHVPTTLHNALNCSSLVVLNISRESMASNGHSPATRVFEAAGAGACLITDAWDGIEEFLTPGSEVLVASDGAEVAQLLATLDSERAAAIGGAARERVLDQHTYAQRALQLETVLYSKIANAPRLERAR